MRQFSHTPRPGWYPWLPTGHPEAKLEGWGKCWGDEWRGPSQAARSLAPSQFSPANAPNDLGYDGRVSCGALECGPTALDTDVGFKPITHLIIFPVILGLQQRGLTQTIRRRTGCLWRQTVAPHVELS